MLQTECFILVTWKWSVFEGKARYLKLCGSVVVSIKLSAHCVSVDWLGFDCAFEYCMLCASKSTGDTTKKCICIMYLFLLGSNQCMQYKRKLHKNLHHKPSFVLTKIQCNRLLTSEYTYTLSLKCLRSER